MNALDTVRLKYITEMISNGTREDGRGMYDFRDIKITKGTLGNAEGSAQVDLGKTRVLVGIKVDLDEPMDDTPNVGNMVTSAELLPLASEDYETGPPSPESIELARVVDRGIRHGNCIDMEKLFIEEGKVWGLFFDIYVINFDGNLIDASALAAMAALTDVRMPTYEDGKVIREKTNQRIDITNVVSSTTFSKINKRIVLDANSDEENAAEGRLSIATDGEHIRSMQKGKRGGFFANEIDELIDISLKKSMELKKIIG
jgi:exosome complex component RRP42